MRIEVGDREALAGYLLSGEVSGAAYLVHGPCGRQVHDSTDDGDTLADVLAAVVRHQQECPRPTTGCAVNPGSEPVPNSAEEDADDNMTRFLEDVWAAGGWGATAERDPAGDRDGRYGFTVTHPKGQRIKVRMPGLPLHRVRYTDEPGQMISQFPRLYVDGSSWVWKFGVRVCAHLLAEGQEEGS